MIPDFSQLTIEQFKAVYYNFLHFRINMYTDDAVKIWSVLDNEYGISNKVVEEIAKALDGEYAIFGLGREWSPVIYVQVLNQLSGTDAKMERIAKKYRVAEFSVERERGNSTYRFWWNND